MSTLSETLIDIARPGLVGPMDHEQARSFAQERPPSLAQSIENALAAMSNAAARIREQDRRIQHLEAALQEIYDHAVDHYDGPEDRTHGPYLSAAERGLGLVP